MQFEIQLTPCDDRILDFNYHHELSSAFYHVLSSFSPAAAKRLHDGEDFSRMKLFTFSPLNSLAKPQIQKDESCGGLLFGEKVWLRFSSIIPEILFGMSDALLSAGELNIRGKRFHVKNIEMVKSPTYAPTMTYRPFGQSGMMVCRYEKDEKLDFQFPDNPVKDIPACDQLLIGNLRHKLQRLGEVRPDIQENFLAVSGLTVAQIPEIPIQAEFLPLTPLHAYRTGLFTVKGVPVRAFRAPVRITAPEAIQRIVWDCGLGSNNGQGFGLVTLGKQE